MKLTKSELIFLAGILDLYPEFVPDDEIKTNKLLEKVFKEIKERGFD
jgi:hypothetical protein